MLDRKKLAVIHIVKKELGLSDMEYRKILKEISGVETAKELNEDGFKKLMRYFVHSKYYQLNPQGLTLKQKLYIQYLAKDLNWDNLHLSNFMRKYYGKNNILDFSKKEAMKLIEALKNIRKHHS